jgi:hypothetical protein
LLLLLAVLYFPFGIVFFTIYCHQFFYLAAVVGILAAPLYGKTATSITSVDEALGGVVPPGRPISLSEIVWGKFQLG